MSTHITLIPLRAAIIKQMRTESRETTELYEIDGGVSTLCPSATNRAFRLNPSLSFTSKMMWQVIRSKSIKSSIFPPYTSNAILTFVISFLIASYQYVLPFFLSSSKASFIVFGMRMPYLCVLSQYFVFSFDMMRSRFFSTYGTQ